MEKRDVGIAYLLLIVAGVWGAHRYYTGRKGSAIAMTITSATVVGLIVTSVWAVVDLFLTARHVVEYNDRVRADAVPKFTPMATAGSRRPGPSSAFSPPSSRPAVETKHDPQAWSERPAQRTGRHRADA